MSKELFSVNELLEKTERRIKSNPNFPKIAQYYLLQSLQKMEKAKEIPEIELPDFKISKTPKKERLERAPYYTDILNNIKERYGIPPQKIYNKIKKEINSLNEIYPIIHASKLKKGVMDLTQEEQYLLFSLKDFKKKYEQKEND